MKAALIYFFDFDADFAQFPDDSIAMLRIAVSDFEFAVRNCGGDDECSGLDTIRNDCVLRAAERPHSIDFNLWGSGATHTRAHFVEQLREIFHFWFARRVIN